MKLRDCKLWAGKVEMPLEWSCLKRINSHCQFLEIESFSRTLTWTRRIMVRPVLNYVVHSISSFHHFIISSFHYFIISSFHHFIISSFPLFFIINYFSFVHWICEARKHVKKQLFWNSRVPKLTLCAPSAMIILLVLPELVSPLGCSTFK